MKLVGPICAWRRCVRLISEATCSLEGSRAPRRAGRVECLVEGTRSHGEGHPCAFRRATPAGYGEPMEAATPATSTFFSEATCSLEGFEGS